MKARPDKKSSYQSLGSLYVVPGYTFFYWGFTIPAKDFSGFKRHFDLRTGQQTKKITLLIEGKRFSAKVRLARQRQRASDVIQIHYDREYETLKALRKLFIYSYATTIRKNKPKLKELMELRHVGPDTFSVHALARQQTDFDEMFRFMEEKNLFDYWKQTKKKQRERFFVDFARKWHPASDLAQFRERVNVIYFLYSEKNRQIYVGKANKFGSRVKIGEGRISLKDWDKFMYFEIDPKHASSLEDIEAYTIRTLASLIDNDVRMKPLRQRVGRVVNRQLRSK